MSENYGVAESSVTEKQIPAQLEILESKISLVEKHITTLGERVSPFMHSYPEAIGSKEKNPSELVPFARRIESLSEQVQILSDKLLRILDGLQI